MRAVLARAEIVRHLHGLLDRAGNRIRDLLQEGFLRDQEGFTPVYRECVRCNLPGLCRMGDARKAPMAIHHCRRPWRVVEYSQHPILSTVQRNPERPFSAL